MLWPKTAEAVVVKSQSQARIKTQLAEMAQLAVWQTFCSKVSREGKYL
jgi:hypothetical protein